MIVNFLTSVDSEVRAKMVALINHVADEFIYNHGSMEIDIDFVPGGKFDALANVQACDDDEEFPELFEIEFDAAMLDRPEDDLLLTLAHEMIHIKQFANGDLKNCTKSSRWKGKYYKMGNSVVDIQEYYNYPWEAEAYGMERQVFEGWKQAQPV